MLRSPSANRHSSSDVMCPATPQDPKFFVKYVTPGGCQVSLPMCWTVGMGAGVGGISVHGVGAEVGAGVRLLVLQRHM